MFNTEYDFYKLSEENRENLVGDFFKIGNVIYYVVKLSSRQFNYGSQQGLIGLNKPSCLYASKATLRHIRNADWFNIYAKSYDDLDCTLDLNGVQLYYDVKRYLDKTNFSYCTYKEIMVQLQDVFGGEIG